MEKMEKKETVKERKCWSSFPYNMILRKSF